jgi:hypothetical protein
MSLSHLPKKMALLKIEALRKELMNPLSSASSELNNTAQAKESPGRLARLGEAKDSPISKI